MVKTRNKGHKIGDTALSIFGGKIDDLEWIFREQPQKDYGIDGEVETVRSSDDGVSGEIFKIQSKGFDGSPVLKTGKVSYPLSKDDLRYLALEVTVPTLLIVTDVQSRESYWFDVKKQGKELLQGPDQESYTLYADTEDRVTKENKSRFYAFLRDAEYLTAKDGMKKHLIEKTVADAVAAVQELKPSFTPKGHRMYERDASDPPHPRSALSMRAGDTAHDLIPTKDFRPEDAAKVNFGIAYDNEEGKKLVQDLQDCLQGKTSSVLLPDNLVRGLEIVAGGKVLEKMGKARIHIMPPRRAANLYIKIKNTTDELRISGEMWMEGDSFVFDSTAFEKHQPVAIRCEFRKNQTAGFELHLNPQNFRDCSHALFSLSILSQMTESFEMSVDIDGQKRELVRAGTTKQHLAPPQLVERFRRALLIERAKGVRFDVKRVFAPTEADLYHLLQVSDLIEKGLTVSTATMTLELSKKPEKEIKGQYMRSDSTGPTTYPLFGESVCFEEGQRAEGRCTNTKELPAKKGGYAYEITIDECSFSLLKEAHQPNSAGESN